MTDTETLIRKLETRVVSCGQVAGEQRKEEEKHRSREQGRRSGLNWPSKKACVIWKSGGREVGNARQRAQGEQRRGKGELVHWDG